MHSQKQVSAPRGPQYLVSGPTNLCWSTGAGRALKELPRPAPFHSGKGTEARRNLQDLPTRLLCPSSRAGFQASCEHLALGHPGVSCAAVPRAWFCNTAAKTQPAGAGGHERPHTPKPKNLVSHPPRVPMSSVNIPRGGQPSVLASPPVWCKSCAPRGSSRTWGYQAGKGPLAPARSLEPGHSPSDGTTWVRRESNFPTLRRVLSTGVGEGQCKMKQGLCSVHPPPCP